MFQKLIKEQQFKVQIEGGIYIECNKTGVNISSK